MRWRRCRTRFSLFCVNSFFIFGTILGIGGALLGLCSSKPMDFFAGIGFSLFSIGFILFIINSWIVGAHFDRVFKKRMIKNAFAGDAYAIGFPILGGYIFYSRIVRAAVYCNCMIYKDKSKKAIVARYLFRGYDFRGNARTIDKVFTFIELCFLLGGAAIFFVIFITQYFWPFVLDFFA